MCVRHGDERPRGRGGGGGAVDTPTHTPLLLTICVPVGGGGPGTGGGGGRRGCCPARHGTIPRACDSHHSTPLSGSGEPEGQVTARH